MTKLFISLIFSLSASYAAACQPPPVNYFELGNLRAIVNSPVVSNIMTGIPITGIKQINGSQYVVESNSCSLEVVVKAKQQSPGLPCGGPFTFTAVVAEASVCE